MPSDSIGSSALVPAAVVGGLGRDDALGLALAEVGAPRREALGDAVAHERGRGRPARRDAHPAADRGAAQQRHASSAAARATVRKTSRHSTFDDTALAWISSSTASSSSPMPKRPITATTKLTPLTSSSTPKVRRTLPDTVSMPIAAMAKPMASDDQRLHRRRAAHADEAREGEEIDGEILRRAEGERRLGDPGGEQRDQDDADQRAEGGRAEGGGERRASGARRAPSDSRRRSSRPRTARPGC